MKPSCEGTSLITQFVVASPNKTVVASVGIEPGGGDETPSVYVIGREHKWTEGQPLTLGCGFNNQEVVVVVADLSRAMHRRVSGKPV